MENFIIKFKSLSPTMTVKFYSLEDISVGWDVKCIIENKEFFNEVVESFGEIENMDDYVQFLLLRKIINFETVISYIAVDEYRDFITKIVNTAKNKLNKIDNRLYISYIRKNIKYILNNDMLPYETANVTLDIICELPGFHIKVMEDICKSKYKYYLMINYDKFAKGFEAKPELMDFFFPKGCLKEILDCDYNRAFRIFEFIYNKEKSNLKIKVVNIIDSLQIEILKMLQNINDENIYGIELLGNAYYLFLKRIKHKYANDIREYLPMIEKYLNSKIMEKGYCVREEFNIFEMLENWKSRRSWEYKLLSLTHNIIKKDEKHVTVNSKLYITLDKLHLEDLCSSNIPSNSDLPLSLQNTLCITANLGGFMLWGIINKDNDCKNEYKDMLKKVIILLNENYNLTNEGFLDDVEHLFDMLDLASDKNIEERYRNSTLYGICMYICALTDKLLRLLRLKLYRDNEKYLSLENSTLEKSLNIKNETMMLNVFDDVHLRHLAYFFLYLGEHKNIGKNYRNALAHWSDISFKDVNESVLYQLLWLFTDVLNSIYIYDITERNKVKEEK